MKRQFIFGTMFSAALAVGVAAQQPPAGPGPGGQTGSPSGDRGSQSMQGEKGGQTVTLSGCLQAAGGSSTGAGATGSTATGSTATTPSTSASSGAQGGFILTNVSSGAGSTGGSSARTGAGAGTTGAGSATTGAGSSSAGAGSATAGTAGTTGGSAASSSYRLMGGESQNLQQYVGQKVQVTGTLAGGRSGSDSSSPTTGAGSATGSTTGAGSTTGSATGAGSSTGAGASATGTHAGATGSGGQALRVTTVTPTGERCSQ